jgi:hypothetical protein|tara:strand:- start:4 stop:357 length:354 start_codon:yes stop_codon:yes gene_type:complete
MRIKTSCKIDRGLLLQHFPQHSEEDVNEALKTSKIEMLFGILQWTALTENLNRKIADNDEYIANIIFDKEELEERVKILEKDLKIHEKEYNKLDKIYGYVWRDILTDEQRETIRKKY